MVIASFQCGAKFDCYRIVGGQAATAIGTFETCRPVATRSAIEERPEVGGGTSDRRDGPISDIGVVCGDPFRFDARARKPIIITPEALLCGDPWRTWRGPPLGEMVLNR
jgi:hypothetical protein